MDKNQLTSEEIQNVFLKAKQEIEMRARPSSNNQGSAKKARVDDLIKKINTEKINQLLAPNILSNQSVAKYTPTLKANQRAKQTKLFKESIKQSSQKKSQSEKDAAFVDQRLKVRPMQRKKRVLTFNAPGVYLRKAQKMRTLSRLENLKQSVAISTHQTGIATAVKLATIQPSRVSSLTTNDNDMDDDGADWWDNYLFKDPAMNPESLMLKDKNELRPDWEDFIDWRWITDLVEHPIEPKDSAPTNSIPLLLTKPEQKKLRRQNRAELQREQQEKIRLGLLKPPAPKVRLANLMRVYGAEAVQNPTRLEAYARTQEQQRRQQHEAMNAERKLTKEEARAKKLSKLSEEPSESTLVSVYKLRGIIHPAHKFKIEKNANQLHMTGVVAILKTCSVIVVEGNDNKQRKFQRLMLHRIKWDQHIVKDQTVPGDAVVVASSIEEPIKNICQQVVCMIKVKCHAFGKIEFKTCPTELYAREQFRKCDVEHYWDLAFSKDVLQAAGELDS